jgi:hypothetical protein
LSIKIRFVTCSNHIAFQLKSFNCHCIGKWSMRDLNVLQSWCRYGHYSVTLYFRASSSEVPADRDSSVSVLTRHGLDGPAIESRWRWNFSHRSRSVLGPTQHPIQWVQPTPSSREVKEKV